MMVALVRLALALALASVCVVNGTSHTKTYVAVESDGSTSSPLKLMRQAKNTPKPPVGAVAVDNGLSQAIDALGRDWMCSSIYQKCSSKKSCCRGQGKCYKFTWTGLAHECMSTPPKHASNSTDCKYVVKKSTGCSAYAGGVCASIEFTAVQGCKVGKCYSWPRDMSLAGTDVAQCRPLCSWPNQANCAPVDALELPLELNNIGGEVREDAGKEDGAVFFEHDNEAREELADGEPDDGEED